MKQVCVKSKKSLAIALYRRRKQMNEPIISPWLIYWAGRIEFIKIICCVVGLVVTALAAPIVNRTYIIQYSGMIIVPAAAERLRSGSNKDIKNRYALATSNRNAQLFRSRCICFTYRINYKMRINGHRNQLDFSKRI